VWISKFTLKKKFQGIDGKNIMLVKALMKKCGGSRELLSFGNPKFVQGMDACAFQPLHRNPQNKATIYI
jgi:hypothetical protein